MNFKKYLLIISMIMILMSCAKKKGDEKADTTTSSTSEASVSASERIFAVNTENISAGSLEDYISIDGNIFSDNSIDVYPDTSGRISSINVSLGDTIRRNQLIARVDPSKPGLRYEPNPVRSPVGGTITAINLDVGAFASPSTAIFAVGDLTRLKIETFIPERYVSYIKKGLEAELSLEAYPERTFTATIDEVSPVLSQTTRSMRIELQLGKDAKEFAKVGMFSSLKLVINKKDDILIVPSASIVTRRGQQQVYVLYGTDDEGNQTVAAVPVKTGLEIDDSSEIVASGYKALSTINQPAGYQPDEQSPAWLGLSPGDAIVTAGQTLLNGGSKVKIFGSDGE